MLEKDLIEVLKSMGEVLDSMRTWMGIQMAQNRLMKLEIRDLKDRVNKLEGIIEREGDPE